MRITDYPLLMEVKEEYLECRKAGNKRDEATKELLLCYSDEITTGAEDDGVLFWIGLADGQYANRELTDEVARKAISALDVLEQADWNVTPGDIRRRREHYALAPMPEKKMGKPRPKFRCSWEIGDTFAYRLTGPYAQKTGTDGMYILLRKASEMEWEKGELFPVVYLSLWDKEALPCTVDEYQTAPLLKINRGRFGVPKKYYEYRTLVLIDSKKQLDSMPLQYLGNFQVDVHPKNEVIIDRAARMTFTDLKCFDLDLSFSIANSQRYEREASSSK